jgi:hypothetical protein
MTNVLHELHELHERRTEIIIRLLKHYHEQQVIDWKQGAILWSAFFGFYIVIWMIGQAPLVPIWQSPPRIFWTIMVVGAVVILRR